jgi:hypothetical protein
MYVMMIHCLQGLGDAARVSGRVMDAFHIADLAQRGPHPSCLHAECNVPNADDRQCHIMIVPHELHSRLCCLAPVEHAAKIAGFTCHADI